MQCVEMELLGDKYYLYYNNEAMFQLRENYPDDVLDMLNGENSRENEGLTFSLFHLLAEQGNGARKLCGYEISPLPDMNDVRLLLTPADMVIIKSAIYSAIVIGCDNTIKSLEDTDITLMEFKKKREKE